jgi:hypothetical protein
MVVTLAESRNNTNVDLDVTVINEFRKYSVILDGLVFDDSVSPSGGGSTLDYGYRRQITQRSAAFRQYNTEYTPAEVSTQKYTVTLAPLGGSFQIDRVLAKLGPAASGEIALQMSNVILATITKFQDAVINGDTAVDANGFDGLDKALVGSATEINATTVTDLTDFSQTEKIHLFLDQIDEFFSSLDGAPTMVLGNRYLLGRVRAAARRAGVYQRDPMDGLLDLNGRPIVRESYGGITFADPGEKAGSANLILPLQTRSIGGNSVTGLADLYAVRVGLNGFHGISTIGGQVVQTWLPDFAHAGAVKTGEVELGPVGIALKATKAAAVLRNLKVR